jgi:lipoyl(octanoyl) transferase
VSINTAQGADLIATVPVEPSTLEVRWLGCIAFEEALALQDELVARKIEDRSHPDTVLLLEHPPVYTIGRTPDHSSLLHADRLPHPLVQINRGGQATFHGPGQLIGYPIIDLTVHGQDLHAYLRQLEELIIATAAAFGVAAARRPGLTGVWVGERKLASLGVGVRRWITMHGFALNVCGSLDGFSHITPCGISGVQMTTLERESGRLLNVAQVGESIRALLQTSWGSNARSP